MDEKKINATIKAIYLGNFKDKWDDTVGERVYGMPIEIEGRKVIAYIAVKKEQKFGKYVMGDTVSKLKVLGWYDFEDPICGKEFEKKGYDRYYDTPNLRNYEPASEKSQTSINLLDVQVPLPVPLNVEYVPLEKESPFIKRYKEVRREIATKIFNQKKEYILLNRKDSFFKKIKQSGRDPQNELVEIFRRLNKEERKIAMDLFDRMILCLMMGKYSFEDYCTFMDTLSSVAKGQGIFLSKEEQRKLNSGLQPTMVSTFHKPSNRAIACICPNAHDSRNDANMKIYRDRIIDINYGTSALAFLQLGELGNEER